MKRIYLPRIGSYRLQSYSHHLRRSYITNRLQTAYYRKHSRTISGMKVWNDQRVGKYPYKRTRSNRIFRPNNEIGAKVNQTWIDPSAPFSPFVRFSGVSAEEQEQIKDDLRVKAKSRLSLVNHLRPKPLDPDFVEPEILCSRRRHLKVTRRNRQVRNYLQRSPTMAPPMVIEDQPGIQEGSKFFEIIL